MLVLLNHKSDILASLDARYEALHKEQKDHPRRAWLLLKGRTEQNEESCHL